MRLQDVLQSWVIASTILAAAMMFGCEETTQDDGATEETTPGGEQMSESTGPPGAGAGTEEPGPDTPAPTPESTPAPSENGVTDTPPTEPVVDPGSTGEPVRSVAPVRTVPPPGNDDEAPPPPIEQADEATEQTDPTDVDPAARPGVVDPPPVTTPPGTQNQEQTGSGPVNLHRLAALPADGIPARAAAGSINGNAFTVDDASLSSGGVLTLRQGSDFFAEREFVVFLFLQEDETVDGRTILVDPAAKREGGHLDPHVHMNFMTGAGQSLPQNQIYTEGYALRLEFDTPKDGNVTGRIWLCTPDDKRSLVAGSFSAAIEE